MNICPWYINPEEYYSEDELERLAEHGYFDYPWEMIFLENVDDFYSNKKGKWPSAEKFLIEHPEYIENPLDYKVEYKTTVDF